MNVGAVVVVLLAVAVARGEAAGCRHYLSYGLDVAKYWKNNGPSAATGEGDLAVNLPFPFQFYGNTYSGLNISSQGYLRFGGGGESEELGNFSVTGESVWLWWARLDSQSGSVWSYQTYGTPPNRIFVIELNGALPQTKPTFYPDGGDLCGENVLGQVRLYEEDNSIDIELISAPIIQNEPFYSGIHSEINSETVFVLTPFVLNYGSGSWNGTLEVGNTSIFPDPQHTFSACPFPIAAKFKCINCIADSDCIIPFTSCGESSAVCLDNECTQPHYNGVSNSFLRPRNIPYTVSPAPCASNYGCCLYGPPIFYPPLNNSNNNTCLSLTKDCEKTINSVLCKHCSLSPLTVINDNILSPKYYILIKDMDIINAVCGNKLLDTKSGVCNATVFNWPNFPLAPFPSCLHRTALKNKNGTISDAHNGKYLPNVDCSWSICPSEFFQQFYFYITFLEVDIKYPDKLLIQTSPTLNNVNIYGGLADLPSKTIILKAACINLYFTSDSYLNGYGFLLNYVVHKIIPEIESVLILQSPSGKALQTDGNNVFVAPLSPGDDQFWYGKHPEDGNGTQIYIINRAYPQMFLSVIDGIIGLSSTPNSSLWNYNFDSDDNVLISTGWDNLYLMENLNQLSLIHKDNSTISPWVTKETKIPPKCNIKPTLLELDTAGTFEDGSESWLYDSVYGSDCNYTFSLVPGGIAFFQVIYLDIAMGDYIEVLCDGILTHVVNSSIHTFQNISLDDSFTTTASSIVFRFYAKQGGGQGFTFYHTVVSDNKNEIVTTLDKIQEYACSEAQLALLTSCSSQQMSGNFGIVTDGPGNYLNSEHCNWNIVIPDTQLIAITLCKFDLENSFDYLTIKSGNSSEVYKFTGTLNKYLPKFYLKTNSLQIFFDTDLSNTQTGFLLTYTAITKKDCNCTSGCFSIGSRSGCYCSAGFQYIDGGCDDIDECALGYCSMAHSCTNTPGSFYCSCFSGYYLTINNTCELADECAMGTHDCSQLCTNTNEGFYCSCKSGYFLDDNNICIAINSGTIINYTISIPNFCSPDSLDMIYSERPLYRTGCSTVDSSNCIFPFKFLSQTYQECAILTRQTRTPMCATKVSDTGLLSEKGNCACSRRKVNIAPDSSLISADSSENLLKLTDEKTDEEYLLKNNLILLFPSETKISQITLYGCQSCTFAEVETILLSLTLYDSNLGVVWVFNTTIDPTFTKKDFYLMDSIGYGRQLGLFFSSDIHLSEIMVFENEMLYKAEDLQSNDCGLSLPALLGGNKIWYKTRMNLQDPFITSFAFELISDTDVFSYFIVKSNNTNISYPRIKLSFDTGTQQANILYETELYTEYIDEIVYSNHTHGNGTGNSTNITTSLMNTTHNHTGHKTYRTIFYCQIHYSHGTLSIYLGDIRIYWGTLDLEKMLDSQYAYFGFESTEVDDQTRTTDGYLYLRWWESRVLFTPPLPVKENPMSNLLIMVVSSFSGVLLISLIIFVLIYYLSKQSSYAISLLPLEAVYHYNKYNAHPGQWELTGDTRGTHAYMKLLQEGSNHYQHFLKLWSKMGSDGIEFSSVFAIHSPLLLNAFANKYLNIKTQVQNKPKHFNRKTWRTKNDTDGLRKWTFECYMELVHSYTWNENREVPIIYAIHGTSSADAKCIIHTGFVALSTLDAGYYGKGIYFSSSVKYTLPYIVSKKGPTIIVSFVISGNAYPIIEQPMDENSFSGAALVPGFHSHYVLTLPNGFPVKEMQTEGFGVNYFDEIVIEQESQILPIFMIKLKSSALKNIPSHVFSGELPRKRTNETSVDLIGQTSLKRSIGLSGKAMLIIDDSYQAV